MTIPIILTHGTLGKQKMLAILSIVRHCDIHQGVFGYRT